MKNLRKISLYVTLSLFAVLLGTEKSQAQVSGDWLGAAFSAWHCQGMATAAGYPNYYFGVMTTGGVIVTNGCMGVGVRGGNGDNGGGRSEWYVVYPAQGEDARNCRRDVHDSVRAVSCDVQNGNEGSRLVCEATRGGGSVKRDLRDVRCVSEVAGPFSRRPENRF